MYVCIHVYIYICVCVCVCVCVSLYLLSDNIKFWITYNKNAGSN